LNYSIAYASALNGVAGLEYDDLAEDMEPLFQMIVDKVPVPDANREGALQMQVSALDYDSYIGVIGIGRISRGTLSPGQQVVVVNNAGEERKGKVLNVKGYLGLDRIDTDLAQAGDIVTINGIDGLGISDTLCDPECVEARPPRAILKNALSKS